MMDNDILAEIEMVLHCDYGGFSIDEEMAIWLVEERQWELKDFKECDHKKEKKYPVNVLFEHDHGIYTPHYDSFKLRTNRDLIDCVQTLRERHKDDDFATRYYSYINKLRVAKVKILASIEAYDGKEELHTSSYTEFVR